MKVVEWQERVTESGIQLATSNTTVPKHGELLNTQAIAMQGPQGLAVAVVLIIRRFEDNRVIGLDAGQCRLLNDQETLDMLNALNAPVE